MSNITLEKVIDLITSKYTAQLRDRHASMVKRVCSDKSQYASGFLYKDIASVIQLIELLMQGIQEGEDQLVDALCSLINHCKLGFHKEKTSDEINYASALGEFLNALYSLVRTEDKAPNSQIVKSVCGLITELGNKDVLDLRERELSSNKSQESSTFALVKERGTKNLRAIADSPLPEVLVQILADSISQADVTAEAVKAISALSVFTPLAIKIGELGVLKDLLVVVCRLPNFREPLVNLCIECVWNIMEQSEDCIRTLAREEIIMDIRSGLQRVIQDGYKLDDRKLRNEIMIILTSVASLADTHSFFLLKEETTESFLEELIRYSSIDELTLATVMTATNSQSKAMWGTEPEDLEFKKLLWTCVSRIISSNDKEAIQVLENSDFIPALLLYLDPSQKNQAVTRWQQPQLKEIQLHALFIFFHILPLVPEHFQNQNGNYCLVHFLSAYADHERKVSTLKTLEIASQCEYFKLELAEEGLFDTLLDIVQSEKDYPLNARELGLSIISNACKDSRENQKEIRRKGWIELIKENLKPLPPLVVGEGDQFALSVLDCLWNAVLCNKRSMLHLIDIEGVCCLLDYLDDCPEILRRMVISCLCKVLQVQRAKTAFIDWNSRQNMSNAAQLMVRIYEEEEKRLGISYGEDGVLKDPSRPLAAPQKLTTKGFERLKEALEAANEQSEIAVIRKKQIEFVRKRDLRASIYCCLSLVGFDSNELLPAEKQKMELIRMYPEFRKGELYLDIQNELSNLGIRPIADDRAYLEKCIGETAELAHNTIRNQNIIAKENQRERETQLAQFYQSVLKTGGFK